MSNKSGALKRLEKELKYFNGDDCEEGYIAGPIDKDDMFRWTASFKGPKNSPYEEGTFKVQIDFPKDYPYLPPSVYFITKVYHPNVRKESGSFWLNLLKDEWAPNTKLINVLKAIQTFLVVPNIVSAKNKEAAKQYIENKEVFEANAKEWTEKYAK